MAKTPQTRKEATSVRLEPKIKYLVEVAARIQRRSVTNYIEWALEESLRNIPLLIDNRETNLLEASESIWSPSEVNRFLVLASNFNDLLTFHEQKIWDNIVGYSDIFLIDPDQRPTLENINVDAVKHNWKLLTTQDEEYIKNKLASKVVVTAKRNSGGSRDILSLLEGLRLYRTDLESKATPTDEDQKMMEGIDIMIETINELEESDIMIPPSLERKD